MPLNFQRTWNALSSPVQPNELFVIRHETCTTAKVRELMGTPSTRS